MYIYLLISGSQFPMCGYFGIFLLFNPRKSHSPNYLGRCINRGEMWCEFPNLLFVYICTMTIEENVKIRNEGQWIIESMHFRTWALSYSFNNITQISYLVNYYLVLQIKLIFKDLNFFVVFLYTNRCHAKRAYRVKTKHLSLACEWLSM